MKELRRGDVVIALRHLDAVGANVRPGTLGVVFEEKDFHAFGQGALVRWMNMGICNVYPGDIEVKSS